MGMKITKKLLTFCLCLAICFGVMTLTASAAGPQTEQAFDYLEHYSDHVAEDPAFDENLSQSLAVVRENQSKYATIWSLLPPILAIVLALLTKKVYLPLAVGILTGSLLSADFHLWKMVMNTAAVLAENLSDIWNLGILLFLVLLGILVCMINKSGGTAAYGRWAATHIKSKSGALLSTCVLGVLVFFDDRFSCLTIGSIMRPVTDKYRISREKLAYLIDSTAAPVCVLVPISTWLAVVSGAVPEGEGLNLFIRAIPYNFYALLTLFTVMFMSALDMDFGRMRTAERQAARGLGYPVEELVALEGNPMGTVQDLLLPITVLFVSCVATMIYTGGFFDSQSGVYLDFMAAFARCNSSMSLVIGSGLALVITALFYLPRKIISVEQFAHSAVYGIKSMAAPILIQIFAWTLAAVTNQLGGQIFVAEQLRGAAGDLGSFLPAVIFLVGIAMSFSTGTSWGTFGALLPIVCTLIPSGELMVISVSACLAGAVCGDHCSPISDTTIMSSAGANCEHISHVLTQLPYGMVVAAVSLMGYLLAGFVRSAWIVLPASLVMMAGVLLLIRKFQK